MLVIKLKNSLFPVLTALLIAIGVIFSSQALLNLNSHVSLNYQAETEMYNFSSLSYLDYLKNFDENTLTTSNVNDDQIEEYRYRFGNLEDQVRDVTEQYRGPLSSANKAGDKKEVTALTAERDDKVAALVTNFTDSEAVAEKITRETTETILKEKDTAIKALEERVTMIADSYHYYVKDSQGRVYKNINNVSSSMSAGKIMKELEKIGVGKAKPIQLSLTTAYLSELIPEFGGLQLGLTDLSGYATFVKDSWAEAEEQSLKQSVTNWRIVLGLGLVVLGVALVVFWRYLQQDFIVAKLGTTLQRLPLDVRLLLLLVGYMASWFVPFYSVSGIPKMLLLIVLASGALLVYLPIVKDLWFTLRGKEGYPSFHTQLQQSVCWRLVNWVLDRLEQLKPAVIIGLLVVAWVMFKLLRNYLYELREYLSHNSLSRLASGVIVLLLFLLVYVFWQRYYRSRELLQQPRQILRGVSEERELGTSLTDVAAQLGEIATIVRNSQAHHLRNEELKTELLTNVSHDLRTPLTSIITYGELLTGAELTATERQEYTAVINQKALRMKHLINDLFEVTKMNNGEIELKRSEVNFGQLLQQTIAEYSEELEQAQLKMLYTKPSESLILAIDGERIWRVFDNLIGNVVKYAMPGTRVYLNLEATSSGAVIELKNVSRYELNEGADNLVERFARGDDARNTEGSGLGLAISHSIISLHEGDLKIDVDGDLFKITIVLPNIPLTP